MRVMAGACAKAGVANEPEKAPAIEEHDFANLELQQAPATRVRRERSSQPDWSQLQYSAFGTQAQSKRL